jgi:broad specificity phosphatase PhoE
VTHPGPQVVVVRHGETTWSRQWRHTGTTDLPLTGDGRRHAEDLRPQLSARSFALVLTSPLQRARQTAALGGFPAAGVDADLCEWNYGRDEGRTTAEIQVDRPGWSIWADGPDGGESLTEVAARADRVIARALGASGDVLLFAHGHILRILAARWIELEPAGGRRLRLASAAPSTLGWEHDYRVIVEWSCGGR